MLTSPSPNNMIPIGGIYMGNMWGKVTYNKQQKAWCVKGKWQGKRVYFSEYETAIGKRVCQTEFEAAQLQVIISNEIAHGTFNPARYRKAKKLHLKVYAEDWLKEIKPDLASGTWHGYESAMRLYIIPTLEDKFLPDIGHADLKELMKVMKHLVPSSRKNNMGVLHALLKDAERDGHISQLPPWIEFKGQNKVVKPAIKYLTVEAQMKILSSLPEQHRPIFLFMMATGCRPSEARAFRKQDVHLKEGYLMFEKAFGKEEELKKVKAEKAEPFPITPEIEAILEVAPRDIISPYLFPNPATGKHYSKYINRIWNDACDAAKVKRFELYAAVRHSFACQLLNSGVDERQLSRLLRHSDPRMVKRYAEYEVATLEKAAGQITRLANGMQTRKEGTS
jgi:integrase